MLPTATPTKMTALAITFLVVPPTFPVTSDNARLKTALEAPVKSEISDSTINRRTVADQLGCLVIAPGHHCETDDCDDGHC